MFISRKDKEWLKKEVGRCVSEARFYLYVDRIRELEWRLESLEKVLLLNYELKPLQRVHTRKGGPERPE